MRCDLAAASLGLPELKVIVLGGKGSIRLNLGCGLQTAAGWINIDGSWNARIAKHPTLKWTLSYLGLLSKEKSEIPWSSSIFIHDVRKPLPFPDSSASAIYASHLLEHLYRDEALRLMKEAYRVLQPGAVLRVVVPDLRAIVEAYLRERESRAGESGSTSAADRFNERLLMRNASRRSSHFLYRIYSAVTDFHSHKWMYDADSLRMLFTGIGFKDTEQRNCYDSRIEDIRSVEHESRILNGAGVCVEGVKPTV